MIISGRILVLVVALATTGVITACHTVANHHQVEPNRPIPSASNPSDCRTIPHELGETEVCGQPQKIAVLGPFVLEPLLALEIQPVAFADHMVWHEGRYDNPSRQIPYLGKYVTNQLVNLGLAWQPSIETLLRVKPDLILGTYFNNANEYETLSELAPTLVFKWDDSATNLRAIAQAVGYPEKAEQLLTDMSQRVVDGRNAFAAFVAKHPNVLLFSTDSRLQSIYMGTSAHGLCSSLLIDLGFNLVSLTGLRDNQSGVPVPISLEAITQVNDADAIILLGSDDKKSPDMNNFSDHQLMALRQTWEKNAIAQSLNVSQAGQVYFIPAHLCLGLPGSIGTELYLAELKQQLGTCGKTKYQSSWDNGDIPFGQGWRTSPEG
ncbi:MAG: iron-siderophore ABC transporter substrate-binding protein [Cyanothece sp. SIO1E1]|nr:iron-siderophore ABC transporter substrate-binding protein [Cyanothece sp. SIO1E1]